MYGDKAQRRGCRTKQTDNDGGGTKMEAGVVRKRRHRYFWVPTGRRPGGKVWEGVGDQRKHGGVVWRVEGGGRGVQRRRRQTLFGKVMGMGDGREVL